MPIKGATGTSSLTPAPSALPPSTSGPMDMRLPHQPCTLALPILFLCLVSKRLPGPEGLSKTPRCLEQHWAPVCNMWSLSFRSSPLPPASHTLGRAQVWRPLWGRRPLVGRAGSPPPGCCLTGSCRCPLGRGAGCPTWYLCQGEEQGLRGVRATLSSQQLLTSSQQRRVLKGGPGEGQGAEEALPQMTTSSEMPWEPLVRVLTG